MKLKTKILPWHEFKTLRDKLQGYNQQDQDKVSKTLYLATYHKLLKLHEQGFPLLLQEGEAFEFDSPPVNAYLLPPLDQNPQTPRWLLVFFVTEDEKSWVQLLTWQTDANRSTIQALANQPRQAIEACNHRLDQRPINLQFVPAPNTSTIHLIFPQGELTLVASPSKGIIVTAWDEQTRTEPWIERYSTGGMKLAVKISRYGDTRNQAWQDDVVTDINGVRYAKKNPQMGRIRGADGILNTPEKNWVYLASNRGYVYRLDKNKPDEKPLKSDTLYDEVLDVLVLPWPDKSTVILATVRNSGVVYLLGDDSDKISILHWQHTGKHIWCLVGRGDNHILAIDERQTLLPLRLNPLDEIKAIHKPATQRLVQLYQEELNHYLSTSLDFKRQELTQFYELGDLALEYFLLGLPLAQAWPLFENWCNKLNGCYKTLNPSQQRTLMDLHYQLINRVFNWLQSCCYKKNPALSDETKELVFAVLLKLLALDNAAPDTLWVLLFRKLDWLTRWAEKLTLPDRYLAQIKPIKEQLKYMRADFACGLNLIRPLNTISSYRLNSQVTHIDDANDGQYAFIESNRDLHLYQSNTQGTDCEKKLSIKHGKYWQGQVQFVRTLASKPNEAKRFLIGTLHGELCVLRWDRISTDNITVEKTKDCLFAVISCLRLDKYNGYLLLGGRNFKGHACLYGLPASADMAELRLLWTDTKPGILSVLRTNQEENRLWAINLDNGELLNWNISTHYLTTPRFVSNQPHYWLNTVQKLHALQYSATQQLLVCGGDGGLTYALDANTGALRWVVTCVGNLRHIAYLAGENSNSDVWLLCTDERSSLIVNNDGCVTGVLEKAGPVSALKVLSQHLLLATMDGRVLVMGNTDKASPIEFNPPPMSGWGAYPVRGGGNIRSATDLCAVLAFESEYTNESLIKMMALCLFAEFLENNNEITDDLEKTFLSFWEQQNLHKKIVFLYRLRNLWLNSTTIPNPTICGFSLSLIRTCWDNLLQNTPELNSPTHDEANLLCKLVSPLLDILDKLIHYRYETDTAKQLQLAITQRIWNTAHSDLSPNEIRVFSAIRLNKVLSVWQQLPQNHSDAQRLFAWCNQVATLAQITETEPLRLLLKQLFQAHLRVLAIDNPWQAWLNSLVSGTEPSKPVPKPLNALALANEQLIVSNQDWELLSDIFGDNKSWQAWLDNLQTILQMVRHTRQQQPHKAWAERAAWRRLREHIVVIGNERFTLAAQQALPALGWQTLENIWSEHIEQSLRDLDQQVRQQPAHYLILATQDHWLDSKHLKLGLNLHNYFPAHLNLNKLSWQGLAINQAGLPKLLQADDHSSTLTLDLHTDTDNKLIGDLQLSFSNLELGQSFTVSYPVTIERNLSHFSSDPQWLGTWQRLEALLIAYTDCAEPFYWLDGDVWSHEERSVLKDLVSHKFNISMADHLWHPTQDLASTENIPLFSPDLALSAPASTQLEQLHALLLPWLGLQNHVYWALALWHQHYRLPNSIAAALTSVLPQPETVNTALTKLLGQANTVADIMAVLGTLPQRALSAWCANEPFYALKPEEFNLATRVYLPAASLLPMDIWTLLDAHPVAVEDLAEMLTLNAETVLDQQQLRLGFYEAAPQLFQNAPSNPNDIDPIAQKLLAKLGAGSVSYQTPAWCLALVQPPLFLNWQDFDRVYLLPKVSSVIRATLRPLPKGLWLCLGETHAPSDLNGVAIALTEQQTFALLHTEQPDEALQWLNRIAGTQLSINPALAFRAAFGLGNLIGSQFLYRASEIQTLWSCLNAADQHESTGSATLIIGGRRMGKTCLRERILYEVRKQQPKRVCLCFNFEGKTELSQSEMFGIKLEFWFFKEMAALFQKQGQLFDYDWGSAYEENKDKRNKARERLEQHLTSIKIRTGHTVLFTFDETEHLVKADTQNSKHRYELFSLFRPLLQANKLCLIATSYPFGADMPYALNIASHNSDSPMYNMFAHKLTLSAWLPSQAWDYLQSRLAGFGVILPRFYRQELIDISRGVTWILQFFGQTLCETLLKLNSTTKIVSTQVWQITRQIVLKEIHKELRQSVERIAEIQDQLHNINVIMQPESLLSQGHLWTAMTNLASAQPLPLLQAENQWSGCLGFYIAELEKELPHAKPAALKDGLIRLAATPILDGDANDGKHYVFANNLLPMWLQYFNGEH